MTNDRQPKVRAGAVLRWGFAAALAAAIILTGFFAGLMNTAGLFFLFAGGTASIFICFSRNEIGAAFRHAFGRPGAAEDLRRSAYVWSGFARNAWLLGVLGSVLNFTVILGGGSRGIADVSGQMIQSFLISLYGLVLAAMCLVPAMKLSGLAGRTVKTAALKPVGSGTLLFERVTGYSVFVLVFGLTVFSLAKDSPQDGPLSVAQLMLHGPAALVVIGGAIALALFLGAGPGAKALTFGFGMTGLIALLLGVIQAMFGFVRADIRGIAAAVAFIISASLYALLGLTLVAAPMEDRELMDGRRERPGRLSGMIWRVFPLLAFLFLIMTFVIVIIPVKKAG